MLAAAALPAAAQNSYRVTTDENFRQEPGPQGRLLSRVNAGTILAGDETRDGWVRVTLTGWIWERSVRPDRRDDFDLVVSAANGENLRTEPNGPVVARVLQGFLLEQVARRTGWVQVRRTGWIYGRSLDRIGAQPRTAPTAGPGPTTPPAAGGVAAAPSSLDRVMVASGSTVLARPEGDTLGLLGAGTTAQVLTRADGWARVRIDGWVRETDLRPAPDGALVGVTAAEVRSAPANFEGKVLRWEVQYISVQTADELRQDMPAGQRFMLARGPLPETGFVYVVLSNEQGKAIDALQPLTYLTILGRVRVARSRFLGNPVLDLVEFATSGR